MTTHEERQRLAAMANALRPDWHVKSLYTLLCLDVVVKRAYRDVALALAWIATDPETRTPARLHEPGPWWGTPQAAGNGRPEAPRTCPACHWPHRPGQACERREGSGPTAEWEAARQALKEAR
jgi:hypothetical protein